MIFDIVFLIILAVGFFLGLRKGIFVEVGTILGIVLGVWGALVFSEALSKFLENYLNKSYVQLVSFILLFVGIMIAVSILSKFLTKTFQSMNLGGIVKILGGIFGLFKWIFISSIVIVIFDFLNFNLDIVKQSSLEKSYLYGPLKKIALFIIPKLKEVFNF